MTDGVQGGGGSGAGGGGREGGGGGGGGGRCGSGSWKDQRRGMVLTMES